MQKADDPPNVQMEETNGANDTLVGGSSRGGAAKKQAQRKRAPKLQDQGPVVVFAEHEIEEVGLAASAHGTPTRWGLEGLPIAF